MVVENLVFMKMLYKNAVLFVFLAVAFSALISCTKTSVAPDGSNQPQASANVETEKKKSDFPPLPSAIMQAEIKAVDGPTFTLNDKKGKVVLINLWATWCGPCRNEMPHLVEAQDKYRDKGFEIIGLDVDQDETVEMINDFAKEMKLNYQLGWADRDLYTGFSRLGKFEGIPQSYLIDRDGHLRGVFLGGSKKVVDSMKENIEKVVNE
jgi:thiol-disulfide isomerase/thioredoxin